MITRKWSEEVLYSNENIACVDSPFIEQLANQAQKNARQRMRLCTHCDEEDQLHEMLIVHTSSTYVRPHKHINKSESIHIIKGVVDVFVFDENGDVLNVIHMGDFGSGKNFYYRLSAPLYHTLLIRSDTLVFHEVTSGPFRREDTFFPSWAPEEDDEDGRLALFARLARFVTES